MIKSLFSRRWILATILVTIAAGVMVRLGIWQLDRLEQRRAFNARVSAQLDELTFELTSETLNQNLTEMEYRSVSVAGEYDFTQEIVIRNQAWNDQAGVHLLTPLIIEGSDTAVFVDRGWIPLADYQNETWDRYAEEGPRQILGQIRSSQAEPAFGGRPDVLPQPGESMLAWNFVYLEAIAPQVPYPILPIYIQHTPDDAWTSLPHRSQLEIELTEGSHLSYAGQWFLFAVILLIGYPIYVKKEDQR